MDTQKGTESTDNICKREERIASATHHKIRNAICSLYLQGFIQSFGHNKQTDKYTATLASEMAK